MQLSIDQKDIDKFLMIGDKVLIKPKNRKVRPRRDYTCLLRFNKERRYKQAIS